MLSHSLMGSVTMKLLFVVGKERREALSGQRSSDAQCFWQTRKEKGNWITHN